MIFQLHLNDEKLAGILKQIGYRTSMVDVVEFRNEYHNRCEPVNVPRLHVILSDGSQKPATEFFERIIDEAIINILKNQKK
jgi:hypothetical protein